jgi:two-component system nitrate/nitrite response regulator NarL
VPVTVLIVDDDPSFREVATELLLARGFEIAGQAATEREAVAAVRRLRPDAVLLDIQLCGSDGFHVISELTRAGCAPRVLLTSSDPGAATSRLAEQAGATGFVPKVELAAADLARYFNADPTRGRS